MDGDAVRPQTFSRPRWLVRLHLAAALLFAFLAALYFVSGRLGFGVLWLVVAGFWLRRFLWARRGPLLEVTADSLVVHLGPGRRRGLPRAEIAGVRGRQGAVELRLEDGSEVRFSTWDLASADLGRLAEALARPRTG